MEPFLDVLFPPFLKCHCVKAASICTTAESRNTPSTHTAVQVDRNGSNIPLSLGASLTSDHGSCSVPEGVSEHEHGHLWCNSLADKHGFLAFSYTYKFID